MRKKNPANQLARECIVTALIQLANQKPFSTISISELTERAGVSRMTFYRNYSSKEEVFRSYCKEIVDAYREDAIQNKTPEKFGEYENILRCFQYFEKYREFIICITSIGLGHILLEALSDYLINTYYKKNESSPRLYYNLIAYAGALFSVYLAWQINGNQETPEEMARILCRTDN